MTSNYVQVGVVGVPWIIKFFVFICECDCCYGQSDVIETRLYSMCVHYL